MYTIVKKCKTIKGKISYIKVMCIKFELPSMSMEMFCIMLGLSIIHFH
jgi:hypothetical protein